MQAVTTWQQDKADLSATEKRWVEKARAGDRLAFEKLYRSHCDRIYALCWRMCGGDRALAEDMVQEAFVRAWNKLDLFKGESKFGTWLHRLTVRLAARPVMMPLTAPTTTTSYSMISRSVSGRLIAAR